jgi:shikimate kinase
MTGPVAIMVGAPGAGKSTVGALVADTLGRPFVDTDTLVEAAAGKTVPEIFFDDGEPQFRKLEGEAVATALESFEGVVALGGGAVLADTTRTALRGYPVVYLTVDFADAVRRIGLGAGRPLLAMNPRATLRHLMDERRPLYEEVAAFVVDTSDRTPAEVAAAVVTALTDRSR